MKGKLIVIEGGDGSGKATQTDLLVSDLKKRKIPVRHFDFPRYKESFYGKLVGRFLSGEFGSLEDISPYLASLPYALDRREVRDEMIALLDEGTHIVSNRYVTSNMAHQAAKLSPGKREAFISWIKELEYRENQMPEPDMVIYLHVPWKTALELTQEKSDKREYYKGLDIAERDIEHRKNSTEVYKWLAYSDPKWETIECIDRNGKLKMIDEIHTELLHIVEQILK